MYYVDIRKGMRITGRHRFHNLISTLQVERHQIFAVWKILLELAMRFAVFFRKPKLKIYRLSHQKIEIYFSNSLSTYLEIEKLSSESGDSPELMK